MANNPGALLAQLSALLIVAGQIGGGWQGFVGAVPQFSFGQSPAANPFSNYSQPQPFSFPTSYGTSQGFAPVGQWGWRSINVNDLPPPMPGPPLVVGVNPGPYALLPAGQGSLNR